MAADRTLYLGSAGALADRRPQGFTPLEVERILGALEGQPDLAAKIREARDWDRAAAAGTPTMAAPMPTGAEIATAQRTIVRAHLSLPFAAEYYPHVRRVLAMLHFYGTTLAADDGSPT